MKPDFIFEASWEVCNKVGGIYTVLSTRAKTLVEEFGDNLIFIGPDFGIEHNPLFMEDKELLSAWVKKARTEGLNVRVGRWNIPGHPISVLVDFRPYFAIKDQLYGAAWANFGVDSLHAYGDYDEASMFSYAAGRVVDSYYGFALSGKKQNVVFQAHEWMTGLGALFVRKHVPQVATIFTTHATSIGRSIAGNNKPLYDYLYAYNGRQMAGELNMEAKHSVERQTAHYVDCFTTVSDVTARECQQLLDLKCDEVLMNGFEPDFVPVAAKFTAARKQARKRLLQVASALTGKTYDDKETLLVATSGRYEWKNKGIDVFIHSLHKLSHAEGLKQKVVAFIEVPGWVAGPREDLQERLSQGTPGAALPNPVVTHNLHNQDHDNVLGTLRFLGLENGEDSRIDVILVPCYLDGEDGIFNMHYYDLLIGLDLSVYPSYYEPWGYTPLESVAFKVPTVTTDLSGFGVWVNLLKGGQSSIHEGVEVIHRTDYNQDEVAEQISQTIQEFAAMTAAARNKARKAAAQVAEQAEWKHFISYYYKAYDIALRKKDDRLNNK